LSSSCAGWHGCVARGTRPSRKGGGGVQCNNDERRDSQRHPGIWLRPPRKDMATGPVNKVVQHLYRAALVRDGAERTDGELLECFVSRREKAALEVLVQRHAQMVWGVCCRKRVSNAASSRRPRKRVSSWPSVSSPRWRCTSTPRCRRRTLLNGLVVMSAFRLRRHRAFPIISRSEAVPFNYFSGSFGSRGADGLAPRL
jgi:hypothetical protein